jgi:hypothetical protein
MMKWRVEIMNKSYKPEDPMMTIQAPPNELIAIGVAITQYLTWVERIPNPTKDQQELVALLRSFQQRVVAHTQHQRMTFPRSREVSR